MATCPLIAIMFSPGSHKQFYIWFYYLLPFLLDLNERMSVLQKCFIFMLIDYGYAIPGSRMINSICIWIGFATILVTLIMKRRPQIYEEHTKTE